MTSAIPWGLFIAASIATIFLWKSNPSQSEFRFAPWAVLLVLALLCLASGLIILRERRNPIPADRHRAAAYWTILGFAARPYLACMEHQRFRAARRQLWRKVIRCRFGELHPEAALVRQSAAVTRVRIRMSVSGRTGLRLSLVKTTGARMISCSQNRDS